MIRGISLALAFAMTLGLGFIAGASWARQGHVTVISLAPDDLHRVRLVETNGYFDRNFQLVLEDLSTGMTELLFRSPDEEGPVGSEQIFWSPDSRQFVLVGRHFLVRQGTPMRGTESLYLLHDLGSGKTWCNASGSDLPSFKAEEAAWLDPR